MHHQERYLGQLNGVIRVLESPPLLFGGQLQRFQRNAHFPGGGGPLCAGPTAFLRHGRKIPRTLFRGQHHAPPKQLALTGPTHRLVGAMVVRVMP